MLKIKLRDKIIALLLCATIVAVTLVILLNPLRKSEEVIKESILKLTPIGMDMQDVIKVIQTNDKWELGRINTKYGYGIGKDGRPGEGYPDFVGVKSVRACVGSYRNLFVTDVLVYWGFDENSKLIDIAIRKDTDSL